MTRLLGGVAILALATAGVPASAAPVSSRAQVPGFAPALAERPLAAGPGAWRPLDDTEAWAKLAHATPATRQSVRWDYASGLIARDRGAEALGVLTAMVIDDPDLTLVPAWRRANGVALAMLGRSPEAIAALAEETLADDAESCLWRVSALAAGDTPRAALSQLHCAMPALRARTPTARLPFVIAAGRAALAAGKYAPVLAWLRAAPDNDVAANLLRGRALLALGRTDEGRLRLGRVLISGTPGQRADAAMSGIETGVAAGTIAPADALKKLAHLRFSWRGGDIERRALTLSLRLATETHDLAQSLASGAILFRYFNLGANSAQVATMLGGQISAAIAPGSTVPLGDAAGLLWNYRDLAPAGLEGTRLVESLVGRLQAAGLYDRAADLLQYRLLTMAQDVEQGPLSVRIASLRILAGSPDRAVRVLRETDSTPYPIDIETDRRRIEAAALELLGKTAEALATLQDIPMADALRAEIYWRAHDWANLVRNDRTTLPQGAMSEVGQVIVLRHAIALAMLGREEALASLSARYAAAFARLPTAPTFAMLTARIGPIDPVSLGKAMAALPSASPAGAIGDLIEAGHTALRPARG